MSNFAATSIPILELLSPVDKASSRIIDALSNTNYGFLEVSVGFRISAPIRCWNQETVASSRISVMSHQNGGVDSTRLPLLARGGLRRLIIPLKRECAGGSLDGFKFWNVFGHRSSQFRELARRHQHPVFQRPHRLVVGFDRPV